MRTGRRKTTERVRGNGQKAGQGHQGSRQRRTTGHRNKNSPHKNDQDGQEARQRTRAEAAKTSATNSGKGALGQDRRAGKATESLANTKAQKRPGQIEDKTKRTGQSGDSLGPRTGTRNVAQKQRWGERRPTRRPQKRRRKRAQRPKRRNDFKRRGRATQKNPVAPARRPRAQDDTRAEPPVRALRRRWHIHTLVHRDNR